MYGRCWPTQDKRTCSGVLAWLWEFVQGFEPCGRNGLDLLRGFFVGVLAKQGLSDDGFERVCALEFEIDINLCILLNS